MKHVSFTTEFYLCPICYFTVLMSLLLFLNVKNFYIIKKSLKIRRRPKPLTGQIDIDININTDINVYINTILLI